MNFLKSASAPETFEGKRLSFFAPETFEIF